MKYKIKPDEKSTVKITITFTPEEWAEANNKAYVQNRHRYGVNGFRKGKVPKHVLELNYGKGLFFEETLNILFSENYPEIVKKEEKKYTFVGDPSLSLDEDFSEENATLIAVVPVKPDVAIENYKGIKIKKVEYTVTDDDVDKDINVVREQLATKAEVKDRPAKEGDIATIDFVGKLDGKEFDGGSADGYDLPLGSHTFIPGFEEGVVGMNLGEKRDIPVTFPEDYAEESLKGKPVIFEVTLHKLTEKILPELNEEFFKKVGSSSLEEYKGKVRERLERTAKNRSLNETEDNILTEIAKTASAEIPQAMIDRQCEEEVNRMEYRLMGQGLRMEDYLQYIGKTREEYSKTFEEQAKTIILHQLIIEKIIELENITASEEEIEEKIAEQAKSVGKEPEEYKKTMDPRQRMYIESDIKVTKLFDFLQANNEMTVEEK